MSEFIPAAAPNFMAGRNGNRVSLIVLHTTVGTMDATIATFQNPGRLASAHYVVGLDGRLVQMVKESDTAYHAGDWNVNLTSIGIEHVDDGNYNGPRTPELYATSSTLVGELCTRYSIPRDRSHIRKHSEVSDAPTGCPDALDVDRIVSSAFGPSSGSLSADMTPEEHTWLQAVYNVLSPVSLTQVLNAVKAISVPAGGGLTAAQQQQLTQIQEAVLRIETALRGA